MVRVARLERAASTSQMWRPTNWATPGYFAVTIIARKSCDSKSFPVCGHLCGQSGFSARFADPAKSSKRPCCKGFRVSAAPIVDESAYAPKAGALPTAQHPVMKLGDPAGRILPNQARYQLRYTRILTGGAFAPPVYCTLLSARTQDGTETFFHPCSPGPASQTVSPASRRQTLTPAMARAKTNQKMHMTRG